MKLWEGKCQTKLNWNNCTEMSRSVFVRYGTISGNSFTKLMNKSILRNF